MAVVRVCKGGVVGDTTEDKEKNYISEKLRNCLLLSLLLLIVNQPLSLIANEKDSDILSSTSIGFEVEVYKSQFNATTITFPIRFYFYSAGSVDLNIEIPIIYLSKRSENELVVTRSGMARRHQRIHTLQNSTASNKAGLGDISITLGWILVENWKEINVSSTFYIKTPTGDRDSGLGTGTFEAGPGLAFSKELGSMLFFLEGSYIFQNRNDYLGKNYVDFLGGLRIYPHNQFFVTIFGKGSTPRSETSKTQIEGRIKLTYIKSRKISWEVYLSKGFTDASPDYGSGLAFTYQF